MQCAGVLKQEDHHHELEGTSEGCGETIDDRVKLNLIRGRLRNTAADEMQLRCTTALSAPPPLT